MDRKKKGKNCKIFEVNLEVLRINLNRDRSCKLAMWSRFVDRNEIESLTLINDIKYHK